MSGYIVGTLIGAGTTILGFAINAVREGRARKEERATSRQSELQQAMRAYLAAIDDLILEGQNHPVPPRRTRLDRVFEERMRGTTFEFIGHILVRLLERAIYGRRKGELLDRLSAASAHLRLIAPQEVEAYMIEGEAICPRHRPGDEKWQEEWKDFRSRMRQGFREKLDESGAWAA
jgi:hypothetical protein